MNCSRCYYDLEGVLRRRCQTCYEVAYEQLMYPSGMPESQMPEPNGRSVAVQRLSDPPARTCGEGIDQFVHCELPHGHGGPCRSGAWSS
jgi:hypothetical protein